jgi:hypothetical protein
MVATHGNGFRLSELLWAVPICHRLHPLGSINAPSSVACSDYECVNRLALGDALLLSGEESYENATVARSMFRILKERVQRQLSGITGLGAPSIHELQ